MHVAMIIGWGVICCVWAALLLSQRVARRRQLLLDARLPVAPEGSICIVVAARNEAASIERCVRRLLAQDYPRLTVVVADDRSEDDTAALVAQMASHDPRLSLFRVAELPSGWLGKSHAIWSATRAVDSDWLLFTDADCVLEPCAARVALGEAHRRNATLLSLWPRNDAVGFWEHLILPLSGGIIALWFGSLGGDPASSPAFANGQFILIERAAYERIGGHRAVRRCLIEDVPLAEAVRAAGERTWAAIGRDLVGVRMYDGLRSLLDGWTRIFVGSLRGGWKIAASVAWLLFGSLFPFVAAAWLAWSAMLHGTAAASPIVVGLCVLHLSLIALVSSGFWRMGGCDRRYLWLYPMSVLIVAGVLCRAGWWLAARRGVTWRGRRYATDARGRIVTPELPANV